MDHNSTEPESRESPKQSSTAVDEVDAQPEPQDQREPEPMETEDSSKEPDDGVVDVSGILKDIDEFNRSAGPTSTSEPLEGSSRDTESGMEAKEPERAEEEAMDTDEPATAETTKPVGHSGDDEGPDTSQAIAALKSLESYDDVDSRESNEPVHFSEDIVDEEKGPDGGDSSSKEKETTEEGESKDGEKEESSKDEKVEENKDEKEDLKDDKVKYIFLSHY